MDQSSAPASEPVDPNAPLEIEVLNDNSPPQSPRRRRNAEASPRQGTLRRFFNCRSITWLQIILRILALNGIAIVLMLTGYGLYHFILLFTSFKKGC